MSQKEMTDTLGHQEVGESFIGNLSKLAGLARQAYEQKRTKDCLDLTRAILLIDPDNADALSMRSSLQSQMVQDLENARAFLQQAQSRDTSEPHAVPTERQGNGSPVKQKPLRLVPGSSGAPEVKTLWVRIAFVLVLLCVVLGDAVRIVIINHRRAQLQQRLSTLVASLPIATATLPEPGTLPPATSAEPELAPAANPEPPAATAVLSAADPRVAASIAALLPPRPIAKQEPPIVAAGKGMRSGA